MKKFLLIIPVLLLLALSIVYFVGKKDEAIRIAFIGEFVSSSSSASVDSFRASEMAIEELNEQGKNYELVRYDLTGYSETHSLKDDLENDGIDLVIGPSNSTQFMAYKDVLTELELPVFLASVSSEAIYKQSDNLFRLSDSISIQSGRMIDGLKQLYDGSVDVFYVAYNRNFSEQAATFLKEDLVKEDMFDHLLEIGDIIDDETHKAIEEHQDAKAIVVVAGPSDAGIIAQLISKGNQETTIFFMAWGFSESTLEYTAGLPNPMYGIGSPSPKDEVLHNKVSSKLIEEKHTTKNTFTHFGYETTYFMDYVVEQSGTVKLEGIQNYVHNIDVYQGKFNDYTFNAYGDGGRGFAMMQIVDGEYVVVNQLIE